MALRDQPYLPLYVQDFLTDEKLMECSASATGIYIRIMCVMHKSEYYGKILLRQKDKQKENICFNFASKLVKHMPYDLHEVEAAIIELVSEGCLQIEGDFLVQKRMVNDSELSDKRSFIGKLGGDKNAERIAYFANANGKAKLKPNAENENEYNNDSTKDSLTVTELSDNNGEKVFKKWGEPTPYKGNPELRTWIMDQSYSDGFKLNWMRYLDYMVMFGKSYMDEISQQHKMKELWDNAKTESEAMECINQTISDNNKSFYELKKGKQKKMNGSGVPTFDPIKKD